MKWHGLRINYIIHKYFEAEQVSKKNVLGAALADLVSDILHFINTLYRSVSYKCILPYSNRFFLIPALLGK